MTTIENDGCTCTAFVHESVNCPIEDHALLAQREMYEEQLSEYLTETGWLRAAENDPRMDNPREW